MPTFGSLFAGIGGFDLGLERAGWTSAWQVEIDSRCRAVLERHWPDVDRYSDVRTFVALLEEDAGLRGRVYVDLICGGFPCQPVSIAGRRGAQDDERWLWPEFERVVRLLRPRYVLVENVPGLLTAGMGDVLGGLAALGYDAEWESLPAAAVGAPHLRFRVFIVAHRAELGSPLADAYGGPFNAVRSGWDAAGDGGADVADPQVFTERPRLCAARPAELGRGRSCDCGSEGHAWAVEPDVGRVAHGVPSRVDRLRALGNAVVPQVAEWIGRRLMEAHNINRATP